MDSFSDNDFCEEITRLLPELLRSVTFDRKNVLTSGSLSISHIMIIDILSERGPCTMGELAKHLNFTMSAVTAAIDKMIEQRLVRRERDKEDRRVVRVFLVSAGKNIEKKIYEFRKQSTERLFSPLTVEEKNVYLSIIRKIHSNITKK